MGRRREVSFISHGPVTRSDLKQERSFFRGSGSTFLQLVIARVLQKRCVHISAQRVLCLGTSAQEPSVNPP